MKKANWKQQSLEKQLEFKKKLGLTKSGKFKNVEYEHILSDEDALTGAMFYCYGDSNVWQNLQEWAKEQKGKKINFAGTGLKNMLRSEHIPYNFFHPLENLKQTNQKLLIDFLHKLFDGKIQIDRVDAIKIEFASHLTSEELLNDKTSFDVYIEFTNNGKLCGLGIEVKYTELSYAFGESEKEKLENNDSEYNQTAIKSNYFIEETYPKLRSKKLKQPWRNHLLGIKLLQMNQLQHFYSVHFYPSGNTYQKMVSDEYLNCIKPEYQHTFIPITFEKFIATAESVFEENTFKDWINYLKDRY